MIEGSYCWSCSEGYLRLSGGEIEVSDELVMETDEECEPDLKTA